MLTAHQNPEMERWTFISTIFRAEKKMTDLIKNNNIEPNVQFQNLLHQYQAERTAI